MLSQHKELVASVFFNLLVSRCPLCVILKRQTQIRVVSYTSPYGTSLQVLHCLTPLSSPPSSPPYLTSSFAACVFSFAPAIWSSPKAHIFFKHGRISFHLSASLFPHSNCSLPIILPPVHQWTEDWCWGKEEKKKPWYSQGTGLLWRNVLPSALCLCN